MPYAATAANYDVTPNDLATGKATFAGPHHGSGSNPFAYDWDSAKPDAAGGAPAGFGNSSFAADVNSAGATQADRYRTFRVSPEALAGSPNPLTIADVLDFSWQNLQLSGSNTWRVSIYTVPSDSGVDPLDLVKAPADQASWYGNRIQATPTTGTLNVWQQLSSSALTFTENNPGVVLPTGSWADVQSAFGNQRIMMIDFTLGANSGGGTQAAQLDGIVFNYRGGASDQINLQAVPLPAAAWAGLGLLTLLGVRRPSRDAASLA
jgi:hypothetical protein